MFICLNMQNQEKERKDQEWFRKAKECRSQHGIDLKEIEEYFKKYVWNLSMQLPIKCANLQNFVRIGWLSNHDIGAFYDIVNDNYNNVIGFVYKPAECIHSYHGLKDKVAEANKNKIQVEKIFITFNVVCPKKGGICHLSKEVNEKGNHWTLVVIDIAHMNSYYCDSLCGSLPEKLVEKLKPILYFLLADLNVNIDKCLENITTVNSQKTCQKFYPVQECNNMCGVILVCMVAIFCNYWQAWLTWRGDAQIPLLSSPSENSVPLRVLSMSWIFNRKIDTTKLYPAISNSLTQLPVNELSLEYTCHENVYSYNCCS